MAFTGTIKGSFYPSDNQDRGYIYEDFNNYLKYLSSNGVLLRDEEMDTHLQCTKASGTMNTNVAVGAMVIEGILAVVTVAGTVTHDAADVSNPRIDIVCVEKNADSQTRASSINILKGTPAASPSAPALTQETDVWQEALCSALIPAGATDSDSFTYTDLRVAAYANFNRNPSFTEDVSTPNLIVEDGYIYLNAAKTGFIQFNPNTNRLMLQLPGCDKVQIATVVVGTAETPPTPTEDYPESTIYLERET